MTQNAKTNFTYNVNWAKVSISYYGFSFNIRNKLEKVQLHFHPLKEEHLKILSTSLGKMDNLNEGSVDQEALKLTVCTIRLSFVVDCHLIFLEDNVRRA